MVSTVMQTTDITDDLQPYIPVAVESLDIQEVALVDSGACINVISHEFFSRLSDVHFEPEKRPIRSFTGQWSIFIGKVHLNIKIGDQDGSDTFYVMPPKGMITSIILGVPWQRKHQATINWATNSVHFTQDDGFISQPFVQVGHAIDNPPAKQAKVITTKGKALVDNQNDKGQEHLTPIQPHIIPTEPRSPTTKCTT